MLNNIKSKYDALYNNYVKSCSEVGVSPTGKQELTPDNYVNVIEHITQATLSNVTKYSKDKLYVSKCTKLLDESLNKQQNAMSVFGA